MDLDVLYQKINKLEFHQSLLLKMISNSRDEFYRLVIEKSLDEEEVKHFHRLCDTLSIKLEEQKAEGFVYFHPLYHEFNMNLPSNMQSREVIEACIKQGLHLTLMLELKKYL